MMMGDAVYTNGGEGPLLVDPDKPQMSTRSIPELFEMWKEEPDQSFLPSFILTLVDTPARDLNNGTMPVRLQMSTAISDVIDSFKTSKTVLIEQERSKSVVQDSKQDFFVINRMKFLERSLHAVNFLDPVSSLIEKMPVLGCMSGNETLDVAVQKLISSGCEEVAVVDGGVLSFILHIDDIFDFLAKESVKTGSKKVRRESLVLENETDEGGLVVETSDEIRKRIARQTKQSTLSPFQVSAQHFCKMYWTEVLLVICILLDVSCTIVDFTNIANDPLSNDKLQVATGIILFVFTYEAIVRVYGFRSALLRLPFDVIDLLIVLVSVIIYCLVLREILTSDSKSVLTLTRIIRGLRMFKIIKLIFSLLMKQRMMYHQDGFALDLSYITTTCIAMSRPAVGSDATFANPIEEVCRFFDTKYPERYLIFDLSTKTSYGDEYFHGRVERIGIDKHNPPRLSQMVGFVERVGKVLDEDPKTCIAVHCKSGRDRTGVMVAAWLLYSRFAESADDAMKWFVSRRISKRARVARGIPMPSQQRYVGYMQQVLHKGGFHTPKLLMNKILLSSCPRLSPKDGACSLWVMIDEDGREVFSSLGSEPQQGGSGLEFPLALRIGGDVRVRVFYRDAQLSSDELCCFVCFHTGFVPANREVFPKAAVDVAAADARCKVFDSDFSLVVEFAGACKGGEVVPLGVGAGAEAGARGRFRRIVRPSQRVVDDAVRMRGRDMRVQMSAATRLKRKVFLGNVFKGGKSGRKVAEQDEEAALGEAGESLCCAAGPPVQHDSVELFQHDAENVGLNRVKSGTFSPSAYIAQTIGARFARSLVSGNKRRFVEDGFDLDLTYVTARVIAMGFPSSGIESRYPFPDHNPPALELLLPCCASIHKFLQADRDNVVAVHCKAGKGRTGLVLVSYFLYCGLKATAAEALEFYGWSRTTDGKGVTITSQIRYAHYFEEQLRQIKQGRDSIKTEQSLAPAFLIHRIRMHTQPHFNGDGGCSPSLTIEVKCDMDHQAYTIFQSSTVSPSRAGAGPRDVSMRSRGSFERMRLLGSADTLASLDTIDVPAETVPGVGTRVAGDVKFTMCEEGRSKVMFFFWLHSSFLTSPPPNMGGVARPLTDDECSQAGLTSGVWALMLSKHEIDRASKDTRCAHFDPDFRIEVFFTPLPGESGTGPSLEAVRNQALTVKNDESEEAIDTPLKMDREAYQRYLQAAVSSGKPKVSFQSWLLGTDPGPFTGASSAPASVHAASNSDLVFDR